MSCQYCFEDEMGSDYLIYPCYCKIPIHVSCFLQWYQKHPKKCILCNSPYHRLNTLVSHMNESPYSDIFFPYDGIYPNLNLMIGENGLQCYRSIEDKIFMAIAFLQVQVLEDLLKSLLYFDAFHTLHVKKVLNMFINGRVPSKYPFGPNYDIFLDIVKILEKYVPESYLGFQPSKVRNHFEEMKSPYNYYIRWFFCSLFS